MREALFAQAPGFFQVLGVLRFAIREEHFIASRIGFAAAVGSGQWRPGARAFGHPVYSASVRRSISATTRSWPVAAFLTR